MKNDEKPRKKRQKYQKIHRNVEKFGKKHDKNIEKPSKMLKNWEKP